MEVVLYKSTQTIPSTTQSTTEAIAVNPNTHRFCELKNTWTECSQCYTYEHSDDHFYHVEYDETYGNHYFEDHTCIYSISTVCDPKFVDFNGHDCNYYASRQECQLGYSWYLDYGVMTEEGFMTPFNCPQCGCDENGPFRPDDFDTLRN